MSADMIDYLISVSLDRAMYESGRDICKQARYQYDQLRASAAEAATLREERDGYKSQRDEFGPLFIRDLCAALNVPDHSTLDEIMSALRATVAEQARQIEAAREMLDLFLKNSREVSEGDCIYCNCEQGGGNEHDCYYDCPMNDVRAWLVANAPTPGETENKPDRISALEHAIDSALDQIENGDLSIAHKLLSDAYTGDRP